MSEPNPAAAAAAAAPQPVRIDDLAPGFTARSTQGEVSLSDHRGRWVFFFSHPGDFTPVCTSEFIAFARAADRFDALGCDLLGLSVDSLYSHIAWLGDIERTQGVTIPFPVIEDPSMAIARAYGMLDPAAGGAATVRASYVIDPDGVIRAMSWYPMTVGRSVEEILRLVAALQAGDARSAATPEGWTPGEALLAPAPLSLKEARTRGELWYMSEAGQ